MSNKNFGANLNWFLHELASYDERDIESGEIEIYGEDDKGNEGSVEISIIELAAAALDRIEKLEAMLTKKLDLIKCGIGGNYGGYPYENELYIEVVELLKKQNKLTEI